MRWTISLCVVVVSTINLFGLSACDDGKIHGILMGDIMIRGQHDFWDRRHGPLIDMRESRWPGGIVPYDYNETIYSVWDLYVIRGALNVIEEASCIKFVRRTNENDYIFITPFGGCWSFVGRQGSGGQTLSLVPPHCMSRGTVIHEVMHALGFWHEHSRSDRDEYIDILWNNVMDAEKQANFAKLQPEALNFLDYPYDYQSVMHYDAFVFSKSPKLPTMRPKKANVKLRDLGLAKAVGTLTESDRKKLNSLYECEGY